MATDCFQWYLTLSPNPVYSEISHRCGIYEATCPFCLFCMNSNQFSTHIPNCPGINRLTFKTFCKICRSRFKAPDTNHIINCINRQNDRKYIIRDGEKYCKICDAKFQQNHKCSLSLIECQYCNIRTWAHIFSQHLGQCRALIIQQCAFCQIKLPQIQMQEHKLTCQVLQKIFIGYNSYTIGFSWCSTCETEVINTQYDKHAITHIEEASNYNQAFCKICTDEVPIDQWQSHVQTHENQRSQKKQYINKLLQEFKEISQVNFELFPEYFQNSAFKTVKIRSLHKYQHAYSLQRLTEIPQDSSCTICMEDLNPGQMIARLPCFHVFHINCANSWLVESNQCPLCRYKLKK